MSDQDYHVSQDYQVYLAAQFEKYDLDLGDDHRLKFTKCGGPGTPTYDRCGAIVMHKRPDGTFCEGSIMFDLPGLREVFQYRAYWTVEKWDPLTLSPSLACKALGCSDHGFIRDGKWVRA